MASQARKSKVKWTGRMNNDILECKRKAKELVSSETLPVMKMEQSGPMWIL